MALPFKHLCNFTWEILLNMDFHSPCPLPPGRIQGALRIHSVVYGIKQDLEMSLWLHIGTHDSKGTNCLAIFCYESRDNGVVGPFPPHKCIWTMIIHGKVDPPVV